MRALHTRPYLRFQDITEGILSGADYLIDSALLFTEGTEGAVPDGAGRDAQIAANLQRWLAQNNVTVESLLSGGENVKKENEIADRGASGTTVLEAILNTLTEQDLSRLSMPLDIVAKLHRAI